MITILINLGGGGILVDKIHGMSLVLGLYGTFGSGFYLGV